jgi:predicted MFS family arabinose efflux permease
MRTAIRAEDLSNCRRWLIFAAMMLPYVFYSFCWNTESFLRPYLADSLGLSRQQVTSFYTLQAFGALIGALLISPVADRYSRRTTLALLTLGFGLASISSLYVFTYAAALLQRFTMGFFLGGVFGCTVSIYVGLFSPTMRGMLSGLVQLVYNGGDALLSWFGRLYAADNWRMVMVIGGAGAVTVSAVAFFAVPPDRNVTPWESPNAVITVGPRKASLLELFEHGRWRLTLRLALLCGLNFFAFQAFNGWITTFLKETHGYSADMVGKVMTALHVGSMIGAIVWGLIADRFGRRVNALGFALAGALIVVYLSVPPTPVMLGAAGFAYGMCLVSAGIWGPYFAELYPEHLRATAASIFNWGRIVSMFGAVISGAIAQRFGLPAIMYTGAATFLAGALLWWSLPETLQRRKHS